MSVDMGSLWMVDETINLNEVGVAADWHRTSMIDDLKAKGLSYYDASAFADFIANEYVVMAGGVTDHKSEECVSDSQWDRLTLASRSTGRKL